ncbi:gypsy retrotransposon integrase-like protein [Trifolium medium]|uniref:Gypsy retrotransposon integrase-like protein n=1 Tax=Trifolium medium TaxID=97028 RepID=A0A392LWX4_9FABA|nr:gypsy retrotransposon integrase-like protein [Trifolium medium]
MEKNTTNNVRKFFERNILIRFGIPTTVVMDNGTKLTDSGFYAFMDHLKIKHYFSSAELPKTNGQAEAANKVILRGSRRS